MGGSEGCIRGSCMWVLGFLAMGDILGVRDLGEWRGGLGGRGLGGGGRGWPWSAPPGACRWLMCAWGREGKSGCKIKRIKLGDEKYLPTHYAPIKMCFTFFILSLFIRERRNKISTNRSSQIRGNFWSSLSKVSCSTLLWLKYHSFREKWSREIH